MRVSGRPCCGRAEPRQGVWLSSVVRCPRRVLLPMCVPASKQGMGTLGVSQHLSVCLSIWQALTGPFNAILFRHAPKLVGSEAAHPKSHSEPLASQMCSTAKSLRRASRSASDSAAPPPRAQPASAATASQLKGSAASSSSPCSTRLSAVAAACHTMLHLCTERGTWRHARQACHAR